jgi:hypothetical protein
LMPFLILKVTIPSSGTAALPESERAGGGRDTKLEKRCNCSRRARASRLGWLDGSIGSATRKSAIASPLLFRFAYANPRPTRVLGIDLDRLIEIRDRCVIIRHLVMDIATVAISWHGNADIKPARQLVGYPCAFGLRGSTEAQSASRTGARLRTTMLGKVALP